MRGWRWRRSMPRWKRRAGPHSLQGKTFAIGFQTGHEMNWLQRAMHVLRDELKNIQVTVSSDYSPDLAEALVRGRLDVPSCASSRPSTWTTRWWTTSRDRPDAERPSPHQPRSDSPTGIRRRDLHRRFEQGHGAARRDEDYLHRCGLDIQLDHGVDNMAMAISLVASTRGLALMPAYAKNLLPWSVVSRPLEGESANDRSGRGLQQGKQFRRFSSCSFPGLRNCGHPCPNPLKPRSSRLNPSG